RIQRMGRCPVLGRHAGILRRARAGMTRRAARFEREAMMEQAGGVERVIAIEEHAWTPAIREALLEFGGDETIVNWSNEPTCNRRLLDVGDERLERMAAMGVDFQVLSITAPGVQQLPVQLAVSLAREANDFLAD